MRTETTYGAIRRARSSRWRFGAVGFLLASVGSQTTGCFPTYDYDLADVHQSYADLVREDNPILYYRCDDPKNSTMALDLIHGRNASVTGMATFGQAGALVSEPDSTSVLLDGIKAALVLPGSLGVQPDKPFSIELWFKVKTFSQNTFVFGDSMGVSASRAGHDIVMFTTHYAGFERWDGSMPPPTALWKMSIDAGAWHHTVATFEQGSLRIFVDGHEGKSVMGGPISGEASKPAVGCDAPQSSCMNGWVDEIAIYDHALTPDRVEAHYKRGSGT